MGPWKWFSPESDPLIKGLDNELMAMLDMARDRAGVPFTITSGLRSSVGNSVLVGAVPDSAHLTGKAVDLWVEDDHAYYAILKGLYAAGFRRIGHYFAADGSDPNRLIPKHLHVDIDDSKVQDCCFVKREQN